MKKYTLLIAVLLVLFFNSFFQNVGIGITAPTERLHVNGNVRFSGALMPAGLPGTTGQISSVKGRE